ncbi:hypothetical protein COLO4_23976 [Corchorus olitorius]|uniref:non-specific serine/threonine protein kinase n=1 Tax=Corchorus olitorius TaxID=93759 RepID=A0A1R3IDM3_9ROSI|nr:hypothetical protein COLO4_23976 [Corchorus olitorius]
MERRQPPIIVNSGSLAETTGNTSGSAIVTLLDSGNLVLRQRDRVIWQSFNYPNPTDTLLPGMKLGRFHLNLWAQVLVSWNDRAHIDLAIWDGRHVRFTFNKTSGNHNNFSYVSNENETYFQFNNKGNDSFTWFVLASTGQVVEYTMSNGRISSVSHEICEESSAGTRRCITSVPSICIDGDDFTRINGTTPTSMLVRGSITMGFTDCELMCRSNCFCVAFASLQDDEIGCQMYFGNKNHLWNVMEKGVAIVYVRGKVPEDRDDQRRRRLVSIIADSIASLFVLILASLMYYHFRKRKNNTKTLFSPSHPSTFPVDCQAKGKLPQGQEIAAKRLSKISRLMDFKNEVTLIYSAKRELLDWRKRVNIIEGVAQGLLYLHKFSRLRIIHRDLKASNILLDTDMNPKISDFGMARIFGVMETGMQTNRIVGTYFGVIILEIVSGKKNIAFFKSDHSLNLLGKAWNLWKEGKCMDLIDSSLRDSCFASKALQIIQLGLLCVQERAADRPTIAEER